MKILLVSSTSLHFVRWTDQLKESGHEVYWFNIHDTGYVNDLSWVDQIIGWKQKYPNLKGRYFIKKRLPLICSTRSNPCKNVCTSAPAVQANERSLWR